MGRRGHCGRGGRCGRWRHLALVLVVLVAASAAFGGARLDGDWIVVEGTSNTLETVARDIGQSNILSYDEETGYALSARSMRVLGHLAIGGEKTTGSMFRYVNSLEFDIGQCGQARILLASSEGSKPFLSIENTRIATLRTKEGNDACKSEGNPITVDAGRLALRSSTISGSFVARIRGGTAEIVDTTITTSNHAGVSVSGIQGPRTRIRGLRSLDHQIYGLEVGPIKGVLALADCALRGGGADLHIRGKTEIQARDCDFDSIRFAGQGGSVRRQWTVKVKTPSPGCRVVAESENGVGVAESVETKADASGVARLILTEYTARAGGLDYLKRGENDSTPHRLTVRSPDGKKVVGQLKKYRVLTRGQEVRIP